MVAGLAGAFRVAARRLPSILRMAGAATGAGCTVAVIGGWTGTTEAKAAPEGSLVMSGDCGGTNTRLVLFRVAPGVTAQIGEQPAGEVVFAKKYLNSEYPSFGAVCQTFLRETEQLRDGKSPQACCLACAGGIAANSVNFTNVEEGWVIDGNALSRTLHIPKVTLINDFEAQGYGLLTLSEGDYIRLNEAQPVAGAPIACVGAGTGLGECFLTAGPGGGYTCWPSEGGHAEFSPRSEITHELLHYMRDTLTEFGTPEKIKKVFQRWDVNGDGTIDADEFAVAVKDLDLKACIDGQCSFGQE